MDRDFTSDKYLFSSTNNSNSWRSKVPYFGLPFITCECTVKSMVSCSKLTTINDNGNDVHISYFLYKTHFPPLP